MLGGACSRGKETTMQSTNEPQWFEIHDNLVLLTHHLADTGSTAAEIAYAVEKPWKFRDEFEAALETLEGDIP
jgi:hypothetical protein